MAQGDYKLLKQRMAQGRAQANAASSSDQPPMFSNPQELVKSGQLPQVPQVRFVGRDIDDVFVYAWSHEVPMGVSKAGKPWKKWQVCLDQSQDHPDECPGCKAGLPVKQRFWANLIWRDAPVFERNQWGSPVKPYTILGNEDQIVVWNTGPSLFGILDELQTEFGDVVNRDVRLKIEFKGQYTIYSLAPRQPEPSELSDNDKKLIDSKYDLNKFKIPMSYNDMAILIPGATTRAENGDEDAAQSFTGTPAFQSPGEQIKSKLSTSKYEHQ